MESLSQNSFSFYDPIRKERVAATPEEKIRQALLHKMVTDLFYPRSLLAVEKELRQLPHLLLAKEIPRRRIDIVAFAKGIHPAYPLFPLLLIECKAVALTPKLAQQVLSYNESVKAPFVALAGKSQVLTGHFDADAGMYRFIEGLPSYQLLLDQVNEFSYR